jgi:hypothetical protein
LHLNTVLGSVEFAHAVLDWCAITSVRELTVASFLRYVYAPNNRDDTKDLRALLARRARGELRMDIVRLAPPRTAAPHTATATSTLTSAGV